MSQWMFLDHKCCIFYNKNTENRKYRRANVTKIYKTREYYVKHKEINLKTYNNFPLYSSYSLEEYKRYVYLNGYSNLVLLGLFIWIPGKTVKTPTETFVYKDKMLVTRQGRCLGTEEEENWYTNFRLEIRNRKKVFKKMAKLKSSKVSKDFLKKRHNDDITSMSKYFKDKKIPIKEKGLSKFIDRVKKMDSTIFCKCFLFKTKNFIGTTSKSKIS
jgi:hypothetical protein